MNITKVCKIVEKEEIVRYKVFGFSHIGEKKKTSKIWHGM